MEVIGNMCTQFCLFTLLFTGVWLIESGSPNQTAPSSLQWRIVSRLEAFFVFGKSRNSLGHVCFGLKP